MVTNVYLAAPLFTEEDNKELDIVEALCKKLGFNIFSPRVECSGVKFGDLDKESPDYLKQRDVLATQILDINKKGIFCSDFILANTRNFDSGTIWEMGYGYAKNVPIVSYTFKNYGLNIMFSQTVITHVDNISLDNYENLENVLNKVKTLDFKEYSQDKLQNFRDQFTLTLAELI